MQFIYRFSGELVAYTSGRYVYLLDGAYRHTRRRACAQTLVNMWVTLRTAWCSTNTSATPAISAVVDIPQVLARLANPGGLGGDSSVYPDVFGKLVM